MENPVIKNILWDVDGTLFDTYPAVTYAYSKALNEMGYSLPLNVIDRHVRTSFNDLVELLHQRFKLDPELVSAKFMGTYYSISPVHQPPFPGVRVICEFIHQKSGLNIAVTHRSPEATRELFDAHNFAALIDDVFSIQQGYPEKLDSTIVAAALEKHSLNLEETLFVGNRECDIQAGRAANVLTCLFGKAQLSHPADYQINDYPRLLEILKRT